ncbi:serine/threonine-protein kinase [Allocoleopsis sp.]|uniref:serine/threonine protein kinase n=1 Tax=Allocoleopsis sp. TaxID=3088169 RepID=UPI002FCE93FB
MERLHQPGDIIAQRYRIRDTLGLGGTGITYAAEDVQTGQPVALKALSLHQMADWKVLELFEREARILSVLNHPAIPRYLDYFQVEGDRNRAFYIVQQLAPGKSLDKLVSSGWHPDEAQVRHLATQILEILVYLHELTPPIIHRDIKPQNILRREDGQVFLVDFGAVQDTYRNTITRGSTVVGTYGYMAPEQFRGQAVPATDLYGLGTTLLFLLTGQSPADLPQRKLKIDFRSRVCVSKPFADWLERMIEPAIEYRFSCAKEALAVVLGERMLPSYSVSTKPKDSSITLTKTEERLVIEIPPLWLRSNYSRRLFAFRIPTLVMKGISLLLLLVEWVFLLLPFCWIPLFPYLQSIEEVFGYVLTSVYLQVALVSVVYLVMLFVPYSIGLPILNVLSDAVAPIRIEIDRKHFRIKRGWSIFQKMQIQVPDISQVKLSRIGLLRNKKQIIVGGVGRRRCNFGLLLKQPEQEWLVEEIRAFLDRHLIYYA